MEWRLRKEGLMAVPFVLLLLIPCSPAMPEDDNANSLFHSLFKRFSDWPLESAFIQADDDDGGGLDDDDDGELRSRDELLHQILRDQHPIVDNQDIAVEDFLWTGSGDYDPSDFESIVDSSMAFPLSTDGGGGDAVVTKTVFATATAPPSPPSLSSGDVRPTPVFPTNVQHPMSHTQGHPQSAGGSVPDQKYLVRTVVLSNMTTLHRGIENFKADMESRLSAAYQNAYQQQEKRRLKRDSGEVEDDIETGNSTIDYSESFTDVNGTEQFENGTWELQSGNDTLREGGEDKPDLEERSEVEEVNNADEDAPSESSLSQSDEDEAPSEERQVRQFAGPSSSSSSPDDDAPSVKIHNIRSSLPEPEIEMIYTVYKGDELIPAVEASSTLSQVSDRDVSTILGFPLITKAEPYTPKAEPLIQSAGSSGSATASWLIAAVVVSSLLVVAVLLAMLFMMYRNNRERRLREERGDRMLLSSPNMSSEQDSTTGGVGGKSGGGVGGVGSINGSLDKAAFTLAYPTAPSAPAQNGANGQQHHPPLKPLRESALLQKLDQGGKYSSGEEIFRSTSRLGPRGYDDAEESPSLADLSSNNLTPESTRKDRHKKTSAHKRKDKKAKKTLDVEQSVFPVRTPDREGFLGPLSDLLEEEITLPGEEEARGFPSSGMDRRSWAYPPHSPSTSSTTSSASSSTVHSEIRVGQRNRLRVEAEMDGGPGPGGKASPHCYEYEPASIASRTAEERKKRAISAKSHVFRKGKVAAARQDATGVDGDKTATAVTVKGSDPSMRPWSAHESRLNSDPVFHMRQRHWEGLCAGKKTLHHGKLLPGSTSEDELQNQLQQQKRNCWSEGQSPKKQVRISEPPEIPDPNMDEDKGSTEGETAPIISAIKVELQKFQRPKSPGNLAGISVISDPSLLKKESES